MPTNPANDILVRAVMSNVTGLPEDAYVNDFSFHNPGGVIEAAYPFYTNFVSEFFRAEQDNGHAVGEYISEAVPRTSTHQLQLYRIAADGSTGSPVYTEDWLGPVTFAGTQGLPCEVAGVLSFHAGLGGVLEESGSTRPAARRRGRIFVGPLGNNAIRGNVPPYRLDDTFLETLRQAAVLLTDDSSNTGWSVWSRADQTLRTVIGGWTDNAPDIQRRRGVAPTTRNVWLVG